MLKNTKAFALAAFMLATGVFYSVDSRADIDGGEEGGSKKVVLTNCVDTRTGEVVGHANDCDSGSSNCVDTTCN
jgi:hypothetical protein